MAARTALRRYLVLTGAVALVDFVFGAVYVTRMMALGMTPAVMGVVFFATWAVSSLVELPSGDWGDRYGQRRLTVLSLLCWGVGVAAFGLATSPGVVMVALLMWAVAQALYSGAPLSLTVNAVPADDLAMRAKVVRLGGVLRWVGAAAGALTVLVGAWAVSVGSTVVVAGTVLLVLAAWVRLTWPEQSLRRAPRDGRLVVRLRAAWPEGAGNLLAVAAVASALLSAFLFAWQPVAVEVLGLAEGSLGLVLLVLTAAAAAGAWATKYTFPPLARRELDLWAAVTVAALLLAVMALGPVQAVVAGVLLEVLVSYVVTLAAARAHALFADDVRNLLWSAFSWGMGMAMAAADLLFGQVWQWLGLAAGLAVTAAVVTALGGMTAVRSRRARRAAAL